MKTNKMASSNRQQLSFQGLDILLLRSSKRKTLTIEVKPAEVTVRAPLWMNEKVIMDFIVQKRPWIEQHINKFPKTLDKINLQNGSPLLYLNETYTLNVANGKSAVHLNDKEIIVPVIDSHLSEEQRLYNKLRKWYQRQTLDIANTIVEHRMDDMFGLQSPTILRKTDLDKPVISARDYKKRWGCCFSNGKISLNWRLSMAPAKTLEYVVIHEMAHLQYMNHSKTFWTLVEHHCPDWRQHRDWLNLHGHQLYRW